MNRAICMIPIFIFVHCVIPCSWILAAEDNALQFKTENGNTSNENVNENDLAPHPAPKKDTENAPSNDDELIQLDDLTVVGDKLAQFAQRNPESVTLIGEEAISAGKFRNVVDAVSTIPGVTVRERRGAAPSISLRGQGYSRLLVLVDGRAVGGAGGSGFDLGSISIESVKRIEIYKPPVPVWLGAGASGGAINIITKSRSANVLTSGDDDQPSDNKERWNGKIKSYGGSYGLFGSQASLSYLEDDFSMFSTIRFTRSDGHRKNQEQQKSNASVKLSWKEFAGGELQAGIKLYDVRRESSGTIYYPREGSWHHLQTGSFDLQWDRPLNDSLRYLVQYGLDLKDARDRTSAARYYDMKDTAHSLRQRLTWTPAEHWVIQGGLDLSGDEMISGIAGTHHRDIVGFYLQEEYENGPWNVRMGQRVDRVSDFEWHPAFDFGLARKLSETLTWKTNVGYTEKVPSFSRMYQSTHDSVEGIRGNPLLDPERALAGDMKLEWSLSETLSAEIGGFYSRTWDYITYQNNDPDPSIAFNLPRVDIGGVELGLKWKPNERHSLTLGYTFKDGRDERGRDLRYCRPHEASLAWTWNMPHDFRLQTRARYGSAVFTDMDNTEDRRIGGFFHVDMMLSRKFGSVEYFLKANNVLDDKYHVHYGYPVEGFALQAGLEWSF